MQKNLEFSQKALTFAIPKPNGAVVQLVRMPACHAGGREFESRPHRREAQSKDWAFFVADGRGGEEDGCGAMLRVRRPWKITHCVSMT